MIAVFCMIQAKNEMEWVGLRTKIIKPIEIEMVPKVITHLSGGFLEWRYLRYPEIVHLYMWDSPL